MGGEPIDLLESAQEAPVGRGLLPARLELPGGQERVGSNVEGCGEAHDQTAVEAQVAALVLRDERLVDAEAQGELRLREAAALPELLEMSAKGELVGHGDRGGGGGRFGFQCRLHGPECRGGLTVHLIIKYI